MKIRIQHQTAYRYAEKVMFGPHRVMLRPREGHDIHIEQSMLEVAPAHLIRWIRDVYGNSIAVVQFTEPASELVVYSEVVLHHYEINPFDFYIEPKAVRYPFAYEDETAVETREFDPARLSQRRDPRAGMAWLVLATGTKRRHLAAASADERADQPEPQIPDPV